MKKQLSVLLLLTAFWGSLQAQTVHCNVMDSINNVMLLTSNYMSYCTKGFHHKKSDEGHSLSLNYYINQRDYYYIIGMSLVTPEKQEIKKGNRLRLIVNDTDTLTLRCLSDVISEDRFVADKDSTAWVVLPKYTCSEKSLQRLLNEEVTAVWQELPDGQYVKLHKNDFRRWHIKDTLKAIFKEINKQKREAYDAELLFNNGQYKYITNDTVVSTDKRVKFSDQWMY